MADPRKSSEDWHVKLVELAARFRSIAEEKLPILQSTESAWTEVKHTSQIVLRDKAVWDRRLKYERAVTEAGMVLISLVDSGIITEQRVKAFVAAREMDESDELLRNPANLFALCVGGPRVDLFDNQGHSTQMETVGDDVPPSMRPAPLPDGSPIDATRQALYQTLGNPVDAPSPDPVQCLRYADFCLSLAKQVPATPPTVKTSSSEEEQGHGELAPSAVKAYGLYQWALTQDPRPPSQKDLAVYNWLKTNKKISKNDLPWNFKSFQTLLGKARKHHGTSKHQSRQGRSGRSIGESEQL